MPDPLTSDEMLRWIADRPERAYFEDSPYGEWTPRPAKVCRQLLDARDALRVCERYLTTMADTMIPGEVYACLPEHQEVDRG